MRLKVCGMKYPENIIEISQLAPDMMGFIFVPTSPRYLLLSPELIEIILSLNCEKVGVFVDEKVEEIQRIGDLLSLSTIQLHGNETPEIIEELGKQYKIIKAFSVDEAFEFDVQQYASADYFLFDTKGRNKGGNGVKYNWELLKKYRGDTPFILSGGIGPTDVNLIKDIKHEKLMGVDVNSVFESEAGLKDKQSVHGFKNRLDELYSRR